MLEVELQNLALHRVQVPTVPTVSLCSTPVSTRQQSWSDVPKRAQQSAGIDAKATGTLRLGLGPMAMLPYAAFHLWQSHQSHQSPLNGQPWPAMASHMAPNERTWIKN